MLLRPKLSGIFSVKILFVHHHHHNYWCVFRAQLFPWLTPRPHHSWPTQNTNRVCRSSVLEMRKLRPCSVKWLAQGHKVGNVKAAGFLPGAVSPIHCLPEAAPWRIDVSSRWQFCGGDRLPLDHGPLFTLLLSSLAFVAGLWRAFDQTPKIMPDANYLRYHLASLPQTLHLVWQILSSVHFVRGTFDF